MAAPTSVISTEPYYANDVTGTNVDAGNNDYRVDYNQANFFKGFSIITGTLTAMTVTVLAFNKDGVSVDVTNALFGVASLSSNTGYLTNVALPVKGLIVRAARTNATNEVNFTVIFPRR